MIGHNIQYLRKKNRLSQQALSDILDIPRTTLGDYERGNTEPNIALLLRLADYFDVAFEALLRQDLSLERYEIARSNDIRILAVSMDSESRDNIELVESRAEAGYLDSYSNPEFIRELPKMSLPHLGDGTFRGFEITGDSMLPVESGSIVICSYVERLQDIKDDRTYVVISKKEGVVYKRVRLDKQNNRLILISDNELYLPYDLGLNEIDEIWQYRAHISFSDKKPGVSNRTEQQISDIQKKVNLIYEQYSDQ